MEVGETEKRTLLAWADGRRWLCNNWKGFILKELLQLTHLSPGLWLWAATYGLVETAQFRAKGRQKVLTGKKGGQEG